jgi:regulatory protein YycH of two-component signal transduction system YycFG
MPDSPLRIDLGTVETPIGNLRFTFIVNEEKDAHVQVYATDPLSAEKRFVFVTLDANGYEQLKAIIRDTDDLIERMSRVERIKRMALPY